MDLMTSALTFAQLVGLLSNFSSEKSGSAAASFEDFMKWLTEKNHAEVIDLLNNNQQTAVGIKALLNEGISNFNQRLETINTSLLLLASGIAGFQGIAQSLSPDAGMSE